MRDERIEFIKTAILQALIAVIGFAIGFALRVLCQ